MDNKCGQKVINKHIIQYGSKYMKLLQKVKIYLKLTLKNF